MMNHFYYSMQGMGRKPEVYSELQTKSYDNLKDQESLVLKENSGHSVVWPGKRQRKFFSKKSKKYAVPSGADTKKK